MKHALAFVAYLGLAVIFTWPVASQLETTVADEGDPLHLSWIVDWDIHALTHDPLHVFDAPVFWPSHYPLAFSENLIGIAALVLPFRLAGLGPIAVYNVALLLGLALSALAGYALGWTLTRKYVPALVAGLLYGFVPYQWGHVQHLQIIWTACVALLLVAIIVYRRAPRALTAAFVAAMFAANAAINLYYFLFGAVVLVLSLAFIALIERREARFWLRLALALAVAGIAVIPILRPYWIVAREYAMERNAGETRNGSATPYDWLIAGGRSALYGPITDPNLRHPERELFPGMVFVFLAVVGCRLSVVHAQTDNRQPTTDRHLLDILILLLAIATYFALVAERVKFSWNGRILLAYRGTTTVALLLALCIIVRLAMRGTFRRIQNVEMAVAALWIAVGFIGSLGLHTPFHTFLFENVPGFRATRVPARWAVVSYAGLAAWAAYGMNIVAAKRWRAILFCALALVDVWPRVRWMHIVVEPSEVDQWIARERAGPVYLLPFTGSDQSYLTMLRATVHHQRMFNGLSSFEPPLHRELSQHPYDARTLDLLEANGCRFVVVRPEWCGWEAAPILVWLQDHLARGRLAFVRRFDFNAGGDWVFAVTRNEALRGSDPRLPHFLAGQPTYSGVTFGRMSAPAPYAEVRGALEITGLAMSPYGIRSVTALVDNGRRRYPLPLFERSDFTALYPWYPRSPRPAFSLGIEVRPRDVGTLTDVQVEIVDGRGKVTRLPDAPITWTPAPAGSATAPRESPRR